MVQDPRSAVRCVFHVDVNSAFLSWSALKLLREDPGAVDLRTIPSAVAGDQRTRHGIITAKSIPAKKFGIRTGEPVVRALRQCPNLVLVSPDFETYRSYSRKLMEILHRHSPAVEQASIDEAYMDMTGLADRYEEVYKKTGESYPMCAARAIRDEVKHTLGFTVNIGISVNKLLAKTASDFTKPDRIHTLYPDELSVKFWPMPIGKLFGCGPATAEKLWSYGITTIGDAAKTEEKILKSILGDASGTYIYRSSRGISDSPVRPLEREAKGYSSELTTPEDITAENYESEMGPLLQRMAEKVSGKLRKDGIRAFTVGVEVKTDAFRRHSRQTHLADSTSESSVILATSDRLMRSLLFGEGGLFAAGDRVRLVGVFVTGLDRGDYHQVSFEEALLAMREAKQEREEKERKAGEEARRRARKEKQNAALGQMMKQIEARYGKGAVQKGTHLKKERRDDSENGDPKL